MCEAKQGVCIAFVCAVSILACGLAITIRPWPWRTTPGEWPVATTPTSHTARQRPLVAPRCMTAALLPKCTTAHSMTSLCTVAYRLPGRTFPLLPSDGRACSLHMFWFFISAFSLFPVCFWIFLFIKGEVTTLLRTMLLTSTQVQRFITTVLTYWKCRCIEWQGRPHQEDPGPPEWVLCACC